MNQVLVIYDNEVDYANSLLDYIRRSMKLRMNVQAFTNAVKFKDYIQYNVVSVLLVNEKVDISDIKHTNIQNICILWEGENEELTFTYPHIYKYQSAKGIIEELLNKYPKLLNNRQEALEGNKSNIISILSLDHKKIQSFFAFQYAKEYSNQKKVLYINMHSWQILSKKYHLEDNKAISEIIYFLKQKSPNLIMKMNHNIKRMERLDYFCGSSFGMDLSELTTSDMKLWMEQLVLWKQYDIIIFDVGEMYPYVMELMKHSQKIIYTMYEEADKEEYDEFIKNLEYVGYNEIIEKIMPLSIRGDMENNISKLIKRS